VPATRPADDFTPRLIPYKDEAMVPLEASEILWQRWTGEPLWMSKSSA